MEDDEYIDNWVSPEKLDLLCEPKYKIGLLGSFYFAGVVLTILWVPLISDRCFGRRKIFLISYTIFIIGFSGLIWSHSLIETYVYMFIIGACFPGRIIIGLTYLIEFFNPDQAKNVVTYFFLSEPIFLILLTAWYQFIDRSWFAIFIITLVCISVAFVWYIFMVPESPKWLYTFKFYGEARRVLSEVAEFNGATKSDYDEQVISKKFYMEGVEDDASSENKSAASLQDLPTNRYVKNVVIMTIIWTVSSFSMYTLNFMNKRFEGNIFVNFYLDGIAGIIGTLIAAPFYNWLKIRWSFISIFFLVEFFVTFYFLHQQGYISSGWVTKLGYPPSQFPEGSPKDQAYYKRVVIPGWIFATKIFVNAGFLNAYQASYHEDIIFPFYKRATSIGICNFVARCATIAAPQVAELDQPIPSIILLSINGIAFFASIFLPSSNDEQKIIDTK